MQITEAVLFACARLSFLYVNVWFGDGVLSRVYVGCSRTVQRRCEFVQGSKCASSSLCRFAVPNSPCGCPRRVVRRLLVL